MSPGPATAQLCPWSPQSPAGSLFRARTQEAEDVVKPCANQRFRTHSLRHPIQDAQDLVLVVKGARHLLPVTLTFSCRRRWLTLAILGI